MEYERIGFWEAIKILAKEAKVDLSKYEFKKWDHAKTIKLKEKIYQINQTTQNFFFEQLKQSEKAKKYLRQRNISLPVYTKFKLWYAPQGNVLINYLLQQWWGENDLLQSWLAKKRWNQLVSFFEDRLMFSLIDQIGNVVWFAGRALDERQQPKYINIGENSIYDKSKFLYGLNWAKSDYQKAWWLVIVEGYMDVIGLFRIFGKSVGVATSWTSLTSSHAKILKRFGEQIFLSFDNDQAGINATIRALWLMRGEWIYPKIIRLKNHKDFDELANDIQAPLQKIEQNQYFDIIEGFERLSQYLQQTYSLEDPIGIKKTKQTILQLLAQIDPQTDYPILDLYLQKTAELLKTSKQALQNEVLLLKKRAYRQPSSQDSAKAPQNKQEITLAAMFWEGFGASLWLDSQFLNTTAQLLQKIQQWIPPIIKDTLQNNLSPQQKEMIGIKQLEIQQNWDQQNIKDLKNLIKALTNNLLKNSIKFLDPQTKQEVSSLYRKLSKL